jgi:hypothetical protein
LQAEEELKSASKKCEMLLEETRMTLSEKFEKQRRDLNAVIKKLEQKVEEQHERLFNYEL